MTASGVGSVPGKPAGTVPILEISPGQYIYQSLAILEYLEDAYPQAPHMRGTTPAAKARVRDLLCLVDEACDFGAFYLHNASALFVGLEAQDEGAARQALAKANFLWGRVEELADEEGPMLAGTGDVPSLVDVVALATVQFMRDVYGFDPVKGRPRIERMVRAFEGRESAELERAPEMMREVARVLSVRD